MVILTDRTLKPKIVKYLLLVIVVFLFILPKKVESEFVANEHTQEIRGELTNFLDTVKAITMCQIWIPGIEGEPYVYFNEDGYESFSSSKLNSVIAGENELKIIFFNTDFPFPNEMSFAIPYILIDYVEYQPCNSVDYIGNDVTIYLSKPPGN